MSAKLGAIHYAGFLGVRSRNEVLLLSATPRSSAETANESVVQDAIQRSRRAMAISPLARFDASKHEGAILKLPLVGPFGMPYLKVPAEVWQDTERRFRRGTRRLEAWRAGCDDGSAQP